MNLEGFSPDFSKDAVFRPCSRKPFEFFEEFEAQKFCMEENINIAWWSINLCHLSYCSEESISSVLLGKGDLLEVFKARTQFAYAVKVGKITFIVFQGSCSKEDALLDMNFIPKKADSMAIHRGFGQAFDYIWPKVESFIEQSKPESIVFAGHSLGGALAYLASMKVDFHSTYTFGAPRVSFGKRRSTRNLIYRFVNCSDAVCTLPPSIFGFKHVGNLMFFDENQKLHKSLKTPPILNKAKSSSDYLIKGNSFSRTNAPLKSLVDHAPINYSRALSRHLLVKELEN